MAAPVLARSWPVLRGRPPGDRRGHRKVLASGRAARDDPQTSGRPGRVARTGSYTGRGRLIPADPPVIAARPVLIITGSAATRDCILGGAVLLATLAMGAPAIKDARESADAPAGRWVGGREHDGKSLLGKATSVRIDGGVSEVSSLGRTGMERQAGGLGDGRRGGGFRSAGTVNRSQSSSPAPFNHSSDMTDLSPASRCTVREGPADGVVFKARDAEAPTRDRSRAKGRSRCARWGPGDGRGVADGTGEPPEGRTGDRPGTGQLLTPGAHLRPLG